MRKGQGVHELGYRRRHCKSPDVITGSDRDEAINEGKKWLQLTQQILRIFLALQYTGRPAPTAIAM
jgi:hypothetical protein